MSEGGTAVAMPGTRDGAASRVDVRLVPYGWLAVVCLLLTLTALSRHGMESYDPSNLFLATAIKHAQHYRLEPAASVLIPKSSPPLTRLLVGLYDVPFYQLLFGLLGKFLVAAGVAMLTWRITRSVLGGFVAGVLLFGLADFIVVTVDIPLSTMSHHIRKPVHLSFRLLAIFLGLVAMSLFLRRRLLLSSLVLALAAYVHPLNTAMFLASLVAALVVGALLQGRLRELVRDGLALVLPFLALTAPYWVTGSRLFPDVAPMSSAAWWAFLLANEPDDASVLYSLAGKGYAKEMVLTLLAAAGYLVWRAAKPLTARRLLAAARDPGEGVLPLLLAPWVVLTGAALWEAFLIPRVPDALNDVFIPLEFRRVATVAALLYVAVLGALGARLLLAAAASARRHLLGESSGRAAPAGPPRRLSPDVVWAVGLAVGLAAFASTRASSHLAEVSAYWSLEHKRDENFLLARKSPAYVDRPAGARAGEERVIPWAAFLDACTFIRKNTELSAAVFNPSYIEQFLACSERQGFLGEGDHGNMTLFSRRFATVYLARFSDIHGGLTYEDLPRPVFNQGPAYAILRRRYLALAEADVERLRQRYPGYGYFLTEVGHVLPYRPLYRNEFFVLYDLGRREPSLRGQGRG